MSRSLIAVIFVTFSISVFIFANSFDVSVNPAVKQTSTRYRLLSENGWRLGDESTQLFWFLQISDIHISKFHGSDRVTDLRKFCKETVGAVSPRVVIASGDLTDGKDEILGSQQYEEEWRAYQSALIDTGVLNKTDWLDIRGNHDNFNVPFLYSKEDLYRNFSAQGLHHKRSYLHHVEADGVKYNFLALDASSEPGTKRPYNFIGMVDPGEFERIETMMREKPADHSVWFAHYPTSTIMTPSGSDNIRKFIGKFEDSSIFVAGHLHTLGSFVYRMYTLQPEGFLELELGDFKSNRLFRLGVFDHGQFSFTDVKLGTWPIAVITNPKNILYNNPFKEDLKMQTESTHIRIVAFSTSEVTQCKVRIDGGDWMTCDKRTKNFFAVPWDASHYAREKHRIELLVGDADGRIFHQEQVFALDGSRNHFDFLARFVLMSDITTVFQIAFAAAFIVCLTPLVVFKTWQLLITYGKLRRPRIASAWWRSFVQKYLVLASIDHVYYSILFWLLYTAIGPWAFNEVIDGHVGALFVWGIFVKGIFVPGTLSWNYGFVQLMFFQFPLTIIIAGVLHRRFKKFLRVYHDPLETNSTVAYPQESCLQVLRQNLPFVGLVLVELLLLVFHLIQNGFVATLLAPIRFWGLVLSVCLFYQAHWRTLDSSFKQSALVAPEAKLATS